MAAVAAAWVSLAAVHASAALACALSNPAAVCELSLPHQPRHGTHRNTETMAVRKKVEHERGSARIRRAIAGTCCTYAGRFCFRAAMRCPPTRTICVCLCDFKIFCLRPCHQRGGDSNGMQAQAAHRLVEFAAV